MATPMLAAPASALAGEAATLAATLDDRGGVGLFETPSARMLPDGALALGGGVAGRYYRNGFATIQPLPGLEATLGETVEPAHDRRFLNAEGGLGVKARLLTEARWRPAVAVGLRDLTGGRYSAEYLVMGKRWYDLDVSLGLGWGRLGESGAFVNPFSPFGGHWSRPRDPETAPAGPAAWFTGYTAPFGGVVWRTPLPDLSLKLELSPDRHTLDRRDNPGLRVGGPVNAGLAWRPWPWIEVGGGYEHGRDAVARVALVLDPASRDLPRPPAELGPQPTAPVVVEGVRAIAWLDPTAGAGDAWPPALTIGRALRRMAERAPPAIEEVTVVAGTRGLDGVAVSALVGDLRRAERGLADPPELRASGRLEPGGPVSALADLPDDWRPGNRPPWSFQVLPRLEHDPFARLSPLVYRASVDFASELDLGDGVVFDHTTRWTPAANLEQLDGTVARELLALARRPVPANRPVRSDLADYVLATRFEGMERLTLSWLAEPAPEWRTRISAGWLEEIYGGLSAEALYRPWRGRWALGAEVDPVRKRFPGDGPWFRGNTGSVAGFASLYYESADGRVVGGLHAGRYLGGDVGATLEVTRDFDTGVRVGVHLTGTTGADRLGLQDPRGVDRFDGGLRLSVPLGGLRLVPFSSRVEAFLGSLGRDSGQRVDTPLALEPLTRPTGYGAINGGWARVME